MRTLGPEILRAAASRDSSAGRQREAVAGEIFPNSVAAAKDSSSANKDPSSATKNSSSAAGAATGGGDNTAASGIYIFKEIARLLWPFFTRYLCTKVDAYD